MQQNERFSKIEEKYTFLYGKTSSLFAMEEAVLEVSKKVRVTYRGSGYTEDPLTV